MQRKRLKAEQKIKILETHIGKAAHELASCENFRDLSRI